HLDVVRDDVAAPLHSGQRLACVKKIDGAPGAGAECDLWVATRAPDESRDVVAKLRLDEHVAHRVLRGVQLVGRDDGLQLEHRRLDLAMAQEVRFLFLAEVAELYLHQETVELSLRKRKRD